jgi:hypothetical protein
VTRQRSEKSNPATTPADYRARGLYDKYTPHSGFLRYVVEIPPVKK